MSRRFLVPPECWGDSSITLPESELYHARRVLRLKEGDTVVVFDGKGCEADAVIEVLRRNEGLLRMKGPARHQPTNSFKVVLLQALPRGKKMDDIVEDATELGADSVIPVVAKHSVSRPKPERAIQQTERWRRRAAEAAKQCGRASLPTVSTPTSLREALALFPKSSLGLVARVGAASERNLHKALAGSIPSQVWLAVGPEGGWSPDEADQLIEAGFTAVSLGPRILRTETAGPALLTLVGHTWGDLG